MASNEIQPHQALGHIVLLGVHIPAPLTPSLDNIMSMRWRDADSDGHGQSSHVRLALYVERGGTIVIEDDGELQAVEVDEEGRFLRTKGSDEPEQDPILRLPRYIG
jgi:hypothetical protein